MIKAVIVDDEINCCETLAILLDRYCPAVAKSSIRKKIFYLIVVLSALQFACNKLQKQQNILDSYAPKVVKAHGYVVPKDSMAAPKVIPAGKPRVVLAGKPKVVPAGIPRVIIAGMPRVCIPGQGSFSLPKTVHAIDSPFIAGIPEVVIAKDAYTKDQNPQNFSSFGKLQGLKSGDIKCMLEDKKGNLWIGTDGGGVSKYDGKSFTNFTMKEGLCSNSILTILEDKSGNLWFGGLQNGVTRYDGKSFTNFTEKEGLSDDRVQSILEDKSGNLWFGTNGGGVSKYDGKSFTHFTEKEGLSNNEVLDILEDKSGNLWFGTFGGGVSKYDSKSFTQFTDKEGLINNDVTGILEDKSGNFWFSTGAGVSKYDGKSFAQFTDKQGLINNDVLSILEDKSGNLWFSTFSGGVSKYDGKSFTHFTEKEGLNNKVVHYILEDKRGNLWFGTAGGLSKYGRNFTHYTVKEGLSDNEIRSILEDKSGNLWFGTWRGGVNRYDGKSFTHFTNKEGMLNYAAVSMLEDTRGNLWFSDYLGVSKYDGRSFTHFTEKEGLSSSDVFKMLQDKSGDIWFGTFDGGVNKYDGKSFTHFTDKQGLGNHVVSILEDKSGNLWFSTGAGVSKYDGKSFLHFTEKEGLKEKNVTSILEDKNGHLWIGYLNSGVGWYDGRSFINFTEKDGLSSNNVMSIFEDKSGNFWFGTGNGLNKLERNRLANIDKPTANEAVSGLINSRPLFKNYTYEDGFSGISVNWGKTIHEARDGTIWIGTGDRLTAFHPGEETRDTIPPNIQLTGLSLFNENIAWQNLEKKIDTSIVLGNGVRVHDFHIDGVSKWYGMPERLSLAYNNNYLTFQFVGITIQSPKKVKYQYKLEGLDENWSALTNRSEATYGNLPHGKYTFKVKAMNGDGYWSREFNYSFTIRPPWWHTWWAYTLFALLFAGFIYAVFRYRINKIRLQHKASELEMQALRAQMNPHFIFNCLSSINKFILKNESESASHYITKFSRLIRLILQNSQAAFISLESELESLQLYLELEVLRFNYHFDYKIKIADDLDANEIKVPPLIIQPYVENAIWHGLMQAKKKGLLEIELFRHEEELCCKITDDGIGRKKAAQLKTKSTHKSMGMQITADRIAILHQRKQSDMLTITDLILPDGTAGGTEVFLKIPLIN